MTDARRRGDELDVSGTVGAEIDLPIISSGATTGYRWFLDLPAELTAVSVASHAGGDQVPTPLEVGSAAAASGEVLVRVRAVATGVFTVRAILARPWERDNPARELDITVRVS